uniref:Putative secreted protein n=1 Tax=Anopheles marajoara TaxID=58244 RepID=A0A2M4C745_9DIPT
MNVIELLYKRKQLFLFSLILVALTQQPSHAMEPKVMGFSIVHTREEKQQMSPRPACLWHARIMFACFVGFHAQSRIECSRAKPLQSFCHRSESLVPGICATRIHSVVFRLLPNSPFSDAALAWW